MTEYISGAGNVGDSVSVKPETRYNKLVLPKLAVYATSENLEKYKDNLTLQTEVAHSSANAQLVNFFV